MLSKANRSSVERSVLFISVFRTEFLSFLFFTGEIFFICYIAIQSLFIFFFYFVLSYFNIIFYSSKYWFTWLIDCWTHKLYLQLITTRYYASRLIPKEWYWLCPKVRTWSVHAFMCWSYDDCGTSIDHYPSSLISTI